jgi:hypothetical protein
MEWQVLHNVINALFIKHGLSCSAGYELYLCFMDCQVLPGATSSSTMFFQRTVPLKSKKTNKKKSFSFSFNPPPPQA